MITGDSLIVSRNTYVNAGRRFNPMRGVAFFFAITGSKMPNSENKLAAGRL